MPMMTTKQLPASTKAAGDSGTCLRSGEHNDGDYGKRGVEGPCLGIVAGRIGDASDDHGAARGISKVEAL